MSKSILEAIRDGLWDFEPEFERERKFPSTRALPGTREKVDILAARVSQGLPLWHGEDRLCFDESRE